VKRLLWLSIAFLLTACASTRSIETPVRIPDLVIQDAGESAYLCTTGKAGEVFFDLTDFAIITQINDVEMSAEYLPQQVGLSENVTTVNSYLLEIPSGNHTVEILYKEEDSLDEINIYWLPSIVRHERSRQTLSFTAGPNQTYVPFVTDKCGRDFFWIEDWGLYVEGSEVALGIRKSDLTKPVVAGERPIKGSCEDILFGSKENQ
jgi:hypothetical protein